MTNRADPEKQTPHVPWWKLLPFVEQIFVAVLFGLLAPGAWGIYLLSRGRILSGVAVLAIWAIAFGWLALFLHRRNLVRLWISVPSAALVLMTCVLVFFLP